MLTGPDVRTHGAGRVLLVLVWLPLFFSDEIGYDFEMALGRGENPCLPAARYCDERTLRLKDATSSSGLHLQVPTFSFLWQFALERARGRLFPDGDIYFLYYGLALVLWHKESANRNFLREEVSAVQPIIMREDGALG